MSIAQTCKALSDPVRRKILDLLKPGKMTAGDIAAQFEMSGATISYHLKILKQAELVREIKNKNFVFYELNTSVLEDLIGWLSNFKDSDSYEAH